MNPRIKTVTPLTSHRLKLEFNNGETKIYDCTPILNFGVFRELANEDYFRRVQVTHGTVSWPNDQDICPDTLYLDSVKA